jgi:hypothetical protein
MKIPQVSAPAVAAFKNQFPSTLQKFDVESTAVGQPAGVCALGN